MAFFGRRNPQRTRMKAPAQDAAVFLVHLWPNWEPAAGFRASVRRVDRDQPEFFTHAAALADYFQRAAHDAVADAKMAAADLALPPHAADLVVPTDEPPDLRHFDFDACCERAHELRRAEVRRLFGLARAQLGAAFLALRRARTRRPKD